MGLDQYAYAAARAGQHSEYWDRGEYDSETREFNSPVTKPTEIAYWRKHPNLQGWMERLWVERGCPEAYNGDRTFNGVELELTKEDIDRLEQDILSEQVSKLETIGFFFGEASDDYYRKQDLDFIKEARFNLFMGLKVFYNSSW